jgi:hypothetical protein
MEETLFAVLSDVKARSTESIQARLESELSVGAPWFD